MKLTDKTCPALLEGSIWMHNDESKPTDAGAVLVLRFNRHNYKGGRLELRVDDNVLRKLRELVEATARRRDDQAAYLRGER